LPKGTWYRWGTDESFTGPARIAVEAPLAEMPIFVRGGSIVPMWPLAQHTGAIPRAQTTLHVWPGDGQLEYYEDDGSSRAFERGSAGWRTTGIRLRQTKSKLTIKFAKPKGGYNPGRKTWKVIVHPSHKTIRVPDDGQAHEITVKVP
jgi:alpha-glucosidase